MINWSRPTKELEDVVVRVKERLGMNVERGIALLNATASVKYIDTPQRTWIEYEGRSGRDQTQLCAYKPNIS